MDGMTAEDQECAVYGMLVKISVLQKYAELAAGDLITDHAPCNQGAS